MSGPVSICVTLPDPPVERLDKALAAAVPDAAELSRSRLARLIAGGAVTRGGEPVTDVRSMVGGEVEIALPAPVPLDLTPAAIELAVVHEDADLVVIDKPAGMVVHPAPGATAGTLVHALLAHCGASLSGIGGVGRPGIVHRLDKDTSGLIVVAKTDRAHHALARQFEDKSAGRTYVAFCHGVPSPAEARLRGLRGVSWDGGTLAIDAPLDRHPSDRQRQAVTWGRGRHALTHARVTAAYGAPLAAARLECRLRTGRTHQIRVHLSHIGHGLIGDPVYGGRRRASAQALGAAAGLVAAFPRQALHAARLAFIHPATGAPVAFEAPLPDDMAALEAALAQVTSG